MQLTTRVELSSDSHGFSYAWQPRLKVVRALTPLPWNSAAHTDRQLRHCIPPLTVLPDGFRGNGHVGYHAHLF